MGDESDVAGRIDRIEVDTLGGSLPRLRTWSRLSENFVALPSPPKTPNTKWCFSQPAASRAYGYGSEYARQHATFASFVTSHLLP